MSSLSSLSPLLLISLLLITLANTSKTPIIGGKCQIGIPDVHIGGKQTQFFLRCEPSQGSERGSGVWVVKSRTASPYLAPDPKPEVVAPPPSNIEPQRPAPPKYNVCVQDSTAQEGLPCSVPMTCLQENVHDPSSFLQCDQNSKRWMRKDCSDGMTFKFEQQSCVAATKQNYHRYVSPCSSRCPLGNACINGTCVALPRSHLCMDGSAPRGVCSNDAQCPVRFRCNAQSVCCPHTNGCCRPLIPDGGSCTSSRQCLRGLVCSRGRCLPDILPKFSIKGRCGILSTCRNSSECDEHMRCQEGCCEVSECPSGHPLSPTLAPCTLQQHCPSETICYAGRCCPLLDTDTSPSGITTIDRHTITTTQKSRIRVLPLIQSNTNIDADDADKESNQIADGRSKAMDEGRAKALGCLERWGEYCSSADQCPVQFDCIMGRCCRVATSEHSSPCEDGESLLMSPSECHHQSDCPRGSRCQQTRCCAPAGGSNEDMFTAHAIRQSQLVSVVNASKNNVHLITELDRIEDGPKITQDDVDSRTTQAAFDVLTTEHPLDANTVVPNSRPQTSTNNSPLSLEAFSSTSDSLMESESLTTTVRALFEPSKDSPYSQFDSVNTTSESLSHRLVTETRDPESEALTTTPNSILSSPSTTTEQDAAHELDSDPEEMRLAKELSLADEALLRSEAKLVLGSVWLSNSTKKHKCPDGGERALSPALCNDTKQCPEGFSCEKSVCCRAKPCTVECSDEFDCKYNCYQNIDESSTLPTPHDNAVAPTQSLEDADDRCVEDSDCELSKVCPEGLTCMGDGRCCYIDALCADGTSPSHQCVHELCPSSLDVCMRVNDHLSICCADRNVSLTPPPEQGAKVRGDVRRHEGGQLLPSGGQGGMVCVHLGCSNSNPCQQGTCSNGYCCSPSSGLQSLGCPSGGQPFGRCMNGLCTAGYACVPSISMCCPRIQIPQIPQIQIPQIPNVCPLGGLGSGSCINGFCGAGFQCNSRSNVCCPQGQQGTVVGSATNPFVCPDGTQAAGACINGKCGGGFSCAGGLCCNATSQNPRCLDGSQAVGACINGKCGGGFTCTTGNVCCPSTATGTPAPNTCPNGGQSIGACVNNLCPPGHTCINNQCCPSTTATCTDPTQAIGPCGAGNTCSDGGFACDTTRNLCCPRVASIGPCVGGVCPTGHSCFPPGTGATSRCYPQCAGSGTSVGPVVAGNCPAGTAVTFGECCRTNRFHSPASYLSGSHYDSPISSPLEDSVGTCADGSPVISGCIKGECGAGLRCSNDLCCAAPSRDTLPDLSTKLHDASPIEEADVAVASSDSAQIGTNQVN